METGSPTYTGHGPREENGEPTAKKPRFSIPTASHGRHREIGLMRWRSEQDAASFVGSASGIHFIRSVYSAVESENSRAPSPTQTPEQNLVPGEEDQLPQTDQERSAKALWQPHEIYSNPSSTTKVSFSDLVNWSQSYFDNWHATHPFLHAPGVLQSFKKISTVPIASIERHVATLDLAIVRSVLSISVADHRQSIKPYNAPRIPAVLLFDSFEAATESVQGTLSVPTTLKILQAAISVQLFLISMLRHNAASRLGGLVVRMMYQIGLHRCPVRYASFPVEDIQLRKRVFWTVYGIDRYLCQSLGLPLGIRDDDIDVCYLDNERHDPKPGIELGMDDRLALLQFLVRHAEVKGLTMELCNKSIKHRQGDPDAATRIIAKLNKLENDIESLLDVTTASLPAISAYQQTILAVLRHECTISLNRPLLATAKDTPDYKAALQSCISAARSIINILATYLSRASQMAAAPGPSSQATITPLLWPSFTWAVWQSAFIVVYAAIEGQLPKSSASRLAEQSVDVLRHIALRGGVWPNACAAAIRDLCRHLNRPHRARRQAGDPTHLQPIQSHVVHRPTEGRMSADYGLSTLANVAETHGQNGGSHVASGAAPTPRETPIAMETTGTHTAFEPTPQNHFALATQQWNQPFAAAVPPVRTGSEMAYGSYNPDLQAGIQNPPSANTLSSDAIFDINNMELFEGFDIPFWLDDDQYMPFMGTGG